MSKRISLVLAFALGLPLAALAPASASYPFNCRIGTNNAVSVNSSQYYYTVHFSRSKGPAASGLRPGQCAYLDRAVRASEPTVLCFLSPVIGVYPTEYNGRTVSQAFFSGPGSGLLRAAIFGPTKLMNFTVHNVGCFQIDTFGV
jgi:hypothetical protein